MAFYQFKRTQTLPARKDEVWDFIASPKNLKVITPDYMGFDIQSEDLPDKMYEGMIISYMVSPLSGFKTKWVTEITHVRDLEYFVDEQRMGPYKMWHHQHHIFEKDNGIMMTDIISYQPPFGILGIVANTFLIKSKLNEIFDFRQQALEAYFAK